MRYAVLLFPLICKGLLFASPGDDEVVFRSDVSLVRVDAQVVDSGNRAIGGLRLEDFVLREEGRGQPIRNFATEAVPVDVLFLLDVSGSMRPHVERIADASGRAMDVLGKEDRMAIMVFDRSTRVRLPFRSDRQEVRRAFDRLLDQERFNGGTDITRAMLDAADYIRREGRRDARKAVVILTDDQTEFDRDDIAVMRALARADAVMCALIAPDAMRYGQYPGGGQRRGTWGNSSGGLGGIIFPPRRNGSRLPGGITLGTPSTGSAGTAEIARESGGDSMSVDSASVLEDTLSRIRQRYALYFNLPEGVKPGQERNIEVDLAAAARRRYPDAEVRYRRVYMSPVGGSDASPTRVTRAPAVLPPAPSPAQSNDAPTPRRRRVAVNEDGSRISTPESSTTAPPAVAAPATPATADPKNNTEAPKPRGWRRVDPNQDKRN